MSSYNPQSRRPRSGPPEDSPVDDLLPEPADQPEPSQEETTAVTEAPLETSSEDEVLPFETPPVEMTDERADLLHRIGVFAAVVAIVLLLALRRRRR
ncbi:MAG TPA: hypothetical protein EYG34_00160 [Acidimicrobiia bacterium]|jgi:hypothetical protein|nr:hypothetical protein [Acidimicrobiia bacterium]HIL45520.1 hypothetical protein [Acidimicrobiia bacterium]